MNEIAVLMASGMGTRMRPITETTPKPLVKVKGTPMIETIINGLIKRGVKKIYIVVGYLSEQFEYLTEKYACTELIKNPDYETINNISSVYYARKVMGTEDCFICEADLFVSDEGIFGDELPYSCYYGKMVEGHSDDWVFDLDEDGYISRVGKVGDNRYNMTGIAYFKKDEAAAIAKAVEERYGKDGYETLFWDDVVNENLDRLKLKVHPVKHEQIVEIDTVEELEKVNAAK